MNTRRFAPLSLINLDIYIYTHAYIHIYIYMYTVYPQFFSSFRFLFLPSNILFLFRTFEIPRIFNFSFPFPSHATEDHFSRWRYPITRGDARSSTLRYASESHSPSPRLRSECLRDLSNKLRRLCARSLPVLIEYIDSSTFN